MTILRLLKREESKGDQQLAAAIEARAKMQRQVVEASARVERLEAAMAECNNATRESARLANEVKTARQQWIDSGCGFTEAKRLAEATTAAATAEVVANTLARDTAPIARELERSHSSLKSKEFDLRSYTEKIAAATGMLIIESPEASDLMARYEASADELRLLRAEMRALLRVLRPEFHEPRSEVVSYEAARIVEDSLIRGAIKSWNQERANPRARDSLDGTNCEEERMQKLAAPWRARAAKLLGSI